MLVKLPASQYTRQGIEPSIDDEYNHRELILEGKCDKAPGKKLDNIASRMYTIETSSGD